MNIGWVLATGWQGSVVGLAFIAGTIVCYFRTHVPLARPLVKTSPK